MYCPQCGEETPDNSSFCRHCGTAIEGDIPEGLDTPDPQEPSTNDGAGESTLRKVIAYAAGGFLILLGLAGLVDSVVAALVFLIGGVIALPIVRTKLANSRGIVIGQWATAAIVIVAFFAGGMIFGAASPDEAAGSLDGANPVEAENIEAEEPQLIEKPATELVIQLDQFGAGWSGGVDGNGTQANGRYFNSGDNAVLDTTAQRYETVEEATAEYDERAAEVQETHSTDTVSVGDEGILYVTGNSAWVLFRDRNVVAQVRYSEQYGTPRERKVREYADLMVENFPET